MNENKQTQFKRKYVHRIQCSRGDFVYMYRRGGDRIRIGRSSDDLEVLEAAYERAALTFASLRLREGGGVKSSPIWAMLRNATVRSKRAGREHSLTSAALWLLLSKQRFRCALTDIPFDVAPRGHNIVRPFAPSIDRIDNTKGYTLDNVRIVCTIANMARNTFSDDDFYTMCKAAARVHKNRR